MNVGTLFCIWPFGPAPPGPLPWLEACVQTALRLGPWLSCTDLSPPCRACPLLSLHGREQSLHSSARKTLERRACLPGD